MHMYYWFGTDIGPFLFHNYNIKTTWSLLSTCVGLMALTILYEAMKILQIKLRKNTTALDLAVPSEEQSWISRIFCQYLRASIVVKCTVWTRWVIEVIHWSVHVALGYILMLAVMTFNGYISIALIIGSTIGYFIFGPVLFELNMMKFQSRQEKNRCYPQCADATDDTERSQSMALLVDQDENETTVIVHS